MSCGLFRRGGGRGIFGTPGDIPRRSQDKRSEYFSGMELLQKDPDGEHVNVLKMIRALPRINPYHPPRSTV
jgi:hypothetical protein